MFKPFCSKCGGEVAGVYDVSYRDGTELLISDPDNPDHCNSGDTSGDFKMTLL